MHKCSSCKQEKSLDKFYKNKNTTSGRGNQCKDCYVEGSLRRYRTEVGLAKKMYASQLSSSKERRHDKPTYTEEELYVWLLAQPDFKKLFKVWKDSGWKKDLVPSGDRLNDSRGYSFDNLQLVTWYENEAKANNAKLRAVLMLDKDTLETLREFESIKQATDSTKINHISCVCRGSRNTAGGYKWKYKVETAVISKIAKQVVQLDKNTLEIVGEFPTASEASRKTGVDRKGIGRVCGGTQKTSGGYKWRYK